MAGLCEGGNEPLGSLKSINAETKLDTCSITGKAGGAGNLSVASVNKNYSIGMNVKCSVDMESLALQDKQMSKITATEMKFVRRVVEKTRRDRMRNKRIREEVGQRKAMSMAVEERQLKWYRRVKKWERKGKQNRFLKCEWKEAMEEEDHV
ncbi:hypothetical protein ANN_03020 [Periplaneta americana]|uniref:Uncharacterized protein n=1 Tax=Periplaneta americana TaxID=6978 RepID=A0ABQ8TXW7_PERAM|nr:hypothetical protein ANN_03020 [Periplaneta americana]